MTRDITKPEYIQEHHSEEGAARQLAHLLFDLLNGFRTTGSLYESEKFFKLLRERMIHEQNTTLSGPPKPPEDLVAYLQRLASKLGGPE